MLYPCTSPFALHNGVISIGIGADEVWVDFSGTQLIVKVVVVKITPTIAQLNCEVCVPPFFVVVRLSKD